MDAALRNKDGIENSKYIIQSNFVGHKVRVKYETIHSL